MYFVNRVQYRAAHTQPHPRDADLFLLPFIIYSQLFEQINVVCLRSSTLKTKHSNSHSAFHSEHWNLSSWSSREKSKHKLACLVGNRWIFGRTHYFQINILIFQASPSGLIHTSLTVQQEPPLHCGIQRCDSQSLLTDAQQRSHREGGVISHTDTHRWFMVSDDSTDRSLLQSLSIYN